MFDADIPLAELAIRTVLVYAALMLLMRLSGKRTVGQFTPFDLLVVMLLSEGVSNAMTGGDESLVGGLLVAFVLVALNVAVAYLSAHSERAHALLEGTPILIGRDGKIFADILRRQHVPESDVLQALREADCSLEESRCLFLEVDGKISVLKRK